MKFLDRVVLPITWWLFLLGANCVLFGANLHKVYLGQLVILDIIVNIISCSICVTVIHDKFLERGSGK